MAAAQSDHLIAPDASYLHISANSSEDGSPGSSAGTSSTTRAYRFPASLAAADNLSLQSSRSSQRMEQVFAKKRREDLNSGISIDTTSSGPVDLDLSFEYVSKLEQQQTEVAVEDAAAGRSSPVSLHPRGMSSASWSTRKRPPAPLRIQSSGSGSASKSVFSPDSEHGSLVFDDDEPLPLTPLSATRRAADSGLSPGGNPMSATTMSFLHSPQPFVRPPLPPIPAEDQQSETRLHRSDSLRTEAKSFRSAKSSTSGRRSFETAVSHNTGSSSGHGNTGSSAGHGHEGEMESVDSHQPSAESSAGNHQPFVDVLPPNELGLATAPSGLPAVNPPVSLFRRTSLGDQAVRGSARPGSLRFRATHSSNNSFSSPFAALYNLGDGPAATGVASPSHTNSSPQTPFSPLFSDPGTSYTGASQPSSSMTPASNYQKLLPDVSEHAFGRRQSADARSSNHMPGPSSIVRGASAPNERRTRARKLDLERSRGSTGLPRSDTVEWIRRTGKEPLEEGDMSNSDSETDAEVLRAIDEDGEEKKSRRRRPPMVLNTSESTSESEGIFFPTTGEADEGEQPTKDEPLVRTRSKKNSSPWPSSPLLLNPSLADDVPDMSIPQPPVSPGSRVAQEPALGLGLDLGELSTTPMPTERSRSPGYHRPGTDMTMRQVEIDMEEPPQRSTSRRLSDLPGWRTSKDYSEQTPHTAPVSSLKRGDDLQTMQSQAMQSLKTQRAGIVGPSRRAQNSSGDKVLQPGKDLQHSTSHASSISAFAFQVTAPLPVPRVEEPYLQEMRSIPASSPKALSKVLFPIRTSLGVEARSGWDEEEEDRNGKWSSKLWNATAGSALALLRRTSVSNSSTAGIPEEPVSKRNSAQLRALTLVGDSSPMVARSASHRAAVPASQSSPRHTRARSRTVVSMHENTWDEFGRSLHPRQPDFGPRSAPASSPLQKTSQLPAMSPADAGSPSTVATVTSVNTMTPLSDRTCDVASTAHTSEGAENLSRNSHSFRRGSRIYYVKSDPSDVRNMMRNGAAAQELQLPAPTLESLRSPRSPTMRPQANLSPAEQWSTLPIAEYGVEEMPTPHHQHSLTRESSGDVDIGLPSLPKNAVSRQGSDAVLAREGARGTSEPQTPQMSDIDFRALQASRDRLRLLASQAMPGATLPHQYLSDDGEGLRKRASITRPGHRHTNSAQQGARGWSSGNNRSSPPGGDMVHDEAGQQIGQRATRTMSIFVPTSSIQAHLLRSVGVMERPTRRRSSRSMLMAAPRKALDSARPSRVLFYAGFLGMPWLWVVGGWWLSRDGMIQTSTMDKVEVWEHEKSMVGDLSASDGHGEDHSSFSLHQPPSSAGHGHSESEMLHSSHTASFASIAFRSPPLSAPDAHRIPRRVSQSLAGVLEPTPGVAYFRSPVRNVTPKLSDSNLSSDAQSSPHGSSPSRMGMPGGLDTLLEDETDSSNLHDEVVGNDTRNTLHFKQGEASLDRYVVLNRCAAGVASATIFAASSAALWAVAAHF